MKIYFMKQKALDSLQAEVADNLNKYQSSSFWMDEHFINQNMPKYYFDTGIEVADYQLISGGPETDFQNAKIVFEAFKIVIPVRSAIIPASFSLVSIS